MKNKVSIFIGIFNGMYVLTATNNGRETYQLDAEFCNKKDSEYHILIKALFKILKIFKNTTIIFYSNNDVFAFEWEKQYKESGHFLKSNEFYCEWENIAKLVKQRNITLIIKGEDDAVSSVLGKKFESEAMQWKK